MIFISFIIAFLINFIFTPWIKKYFANKGIVDKPDFRSQHLKPIVRVGGISIFSSFIITLIIVHFFGLINFEGTFGLSFLTTILLGSSLIFIVGLVDDLLNLSPFVRLFLQFSTASLMYVGNIRIEVIQFPYLSNIDLPIVLSYIITILWIVGITNAINWLDGLDGLISGIIFIYFFGLVISSTIIQESNLAITSAIISGSCLGFLKYNKYPASIIMGDSGSNFLGFILSIFSIYAFKTINSEINFHYSLIFLCLPILDMIFVIIKRILNKKSPFYPDRNHIHHRLLRNGFNETNTVLIIYSIVFVTSLSLITYLKIS